MKKLLFATILFTASIIWLHTPVSAAIIEQKIDRQLELKGEYVQVTEVLSTNVTSNIHYIPAGSEISFRIFNPILRDEKATEKINLTRPTITLKYGEQNLAFTTKIENQDIIVSARYPGTVRGKGPDITISYQSYALTSQTGAVFDLYIPSFIEGFQFENETTSLDIATSVIIPKRLGDINFITPNVEVEENDDNYRINFSREDLTGVISWIQIGTTQYYQFEIKQPYTASSDTALFTNEYTVMIPRNIDAGPLEQRVFFEEITPRPEYVRTDKDGNLLAKFRLPANLSGEILVKGYIQVRDTKGFNLEDSGGINDINPDILGAYTASAEYWEVNAPAIQQVAQELKGNKTDVYEILNATYNYVVDLIDYSEVKRFGINERQGALRTLQGGAAVCMEYSDLFIALMRAQGIPARAAFGYGYDPRSTNGVDTAHQWAEVFIPSLNEWIMVDTTWGESGSAIIGGDLNHFYKYVAANSPQDPAPVSVKFFGDIAEIQEESFVIQAVASPPSDRGNYLSQTEMLNTYLYIDPNSNPVTRVLSAVSDFAGQFNSRVDNWLEEDFQIVSGDQRQLVRFALYVIPFLCLLILSLLWMAHKSGKNREENLANFVNNESTAVAKQ